ncbi:MAG TPA: tyrosine-type recombinase/integrase [Dehalococcoidales bacterium]|nr:tyrosine-type recombinase/integrase [Dehalococcoidales bacterium]
MLTEQAIQEFMSSRGGLRPKTQREYRNHLIHFQKSFPDLPTTPQSLQSWLNGFHRVRGDQALAPETIHSRFRTIRAFYRQIHLWHPKIRNPMPLVRPPRLMPKAMRTFTEGELYQIFTLPLSLSERAMVTLFLDTGIRAQECAGLIWDNVRPNYIIVNGKTGERDVPISETTSRLLQALTTQSNHKRYVFQGKRGPLTYEGIYKTIRRICRRANIDGRRTSPQTFRHTFGTEFASSGACDPKTLQDIMGHSDFKTTLRYIHNNRKRLINNHQLCTPLRLISTAAQGSLFETSDTIKEAEAIIEAKRRA